MAKRPALNGGLVILFVKQGGAVLQAGANSDRSGRC